jgi:hypothetical protein
LDVRAGGVFAFADSTGAGFFAEWQEQTAKARPTSIATRIWSFATRIFLFGLSTRFIYQFI